MNEKELAERLQENYLEPEQIVALMDEFAEVSKSIHKKLEAAGMTLDENYKDELVFNWAAWEIMYSETYQEYVRKLLIAETFIYAIRDFFIYNFRNQNC